MPSHSLHTSTASPEDTCRLAQRLAPLLTAGDTVLLEGSIGAGKSHFARCLIRSLLDVPEDIPSPTFTLVQTYATRAGELWHADLYRLSDMSEVEELGLTEAFSNAICLVEWPDRLGEEAPKDALTLRLETPHSDDRRDLTLTWEAPMWTQKLQKVLDG